MAFEQRAARRQKVRYNSDNDDNPLVHQLYDHDGNKLTPTAGASNNTITIYKPGSTTAVLTATDMTIDGTLLTYSVTTTTVADFPVDTGYRAEIQVTSGGLTYDDKLIFDVVKFLLRLNIGFDQLVALDDGIRGMKHDGDDQFKALIVACEDIIQSKIRAKVIKDKKLLENMILDQAELATPARFYMLHRLWFNKGDTGRSDAYRADFNEALKIALSSIQYDDDQDGEESADIGDVQSVRIRM